MIDDDDVLAAAILTPAGGRGAFGCILTILSLALVIGLAVAASQNKDECGKRTCENGSEPKLLKGECLCVSTAKP